MSGSIFHGTSDTEVIAYLHHPEPSADPQHRGWPSAAPWTTLKGAYSLVIMTHTKLIAARDPNGFRPLCIGELPDGAGYAFASESCALDAVGAEFVRDVPPGEIVVCRPRRACAASTPTAAPRPTAICVFEYIYFARPDSVIEGTCVHEARLRAGAFPGAGASRGGGRGHRRARLRPGRRPGLCPGRAASPTASALSKTSISAAPSSSPTRSSGKTACASSSTPLQSTVKGKRVVLVDDSIVRGTTSARIVRLLREAGAKEVHYPHLRPALCPSLLLRHRH